MQELQRINERVWNIRVRYQPGCSRKLPIVNSLKNLQGITFPSGKISVLEVSAKQYPANIDPLMQELQRINERVWNIRVRYQPGLDYEECSIPAH
jgi:hypothetical protein